MLELTTRGTVRAAIERAKEDVAEAVDFADVENALIEAAESIEISKIESLEEFATALRSAAEEIVSDVFKDDEPDESDPNFKVAQAEYELREQDHLERLRTRALAALEEHTV